VNKLPDFYTLFKKVAKNIEACFEKIFSYLACSQIWLNYPADHCHFGYNTKLPKKTLGGTLKIKIKIYFHRHTRLILDVGPPIDS
jgi:hypothetical protein